MAKDTKYYGLSGSQITAIPNRECEGCDVGEIAENCDFELVLTKEGLKELKTSVNRFFPKKKTSLEATIAKMYRDFEEADVEEALAEYNEKHNTGCW